MPDQNLIDIVAVNPPRYAAEVGEGGVMSFATRVRRVTKDHPQLAALKKWPEGEIREVWEILHLDGSFGGIVLRVAGGGYALVRKNDYYYTTESRLEHAAWCVVTYN